MREEYHYVSSASSSSAAAARNMPVHITSEQGCVIETVISHLRGAALCALFPPEQDEQRCTCLLSCVNAAGFTLAELVGPPWPRPRPELHVSARQTHTRLSSGARALPLYPSLPPSIHPSVQMSAADIYSSEPWTKLGSSSQKKNVGVVPFWKKTRKKNGNVSNQRF